MTSPGGNQSDDDRSARTGDRAQPSRDPAEVTTNHADDDDFPSPFPHPPWTVGLVLVAAGITLLFGLLVDPVWLVVGSPFVLVLVLWLYVRLFARR